jgi:7-carboxy-7-deazaguanine synthase
MKISEIFSSIQGEGRFMGTPTLFIRLSGCTRNCSFCDTKYHTKSKPMAPEKLIAIIRKNKLKNICWTGGEPLLQKELIYQIIQATKNKFHTIETNGDLLGKEDSIHFDNITCSPKDILTAKKVHALKKYFSLDIKVVSDGNDFDKDMLKFADYVMPLTTKNKKANKVIEKAVWQYCVRTGKLFSPRLQYLIFGNKKNI